MQVDWTPRLQGTVGQAQTQTPPPDDWDCVPQLPGVAELVFSRYLEGSGYDKCLEIYNGLQKTVTLRDYELQTFNNGNSVPTTKDLGTLNYSLLSSWWRLPASGGRVCFCDDGADGGFFGATQSSNSTDDFNPCLPLPGSALHFNGDDQIRLVRKNDSAIIDLVGVNGAKFSVGTGADGGTGGSSAVVVNDAGTNGCLLRLANTGSCTTSWEGGPHAENCGARWTVRTEGDWKTDCGLQGKKECVAAAGVGNSAGNENGATTAIVGGGSAAGSSATGGSGGGSSATPGMDKVTAVSAAVRAKPFWNNLSILVFSAFILWTRQNCNGWIDVIDDFFCSGI